MAASLGIESTNLSDQQFTRLDTINSVNRFVF